MDKDYARKLAERIYKEEDDMCPQDSDLLVIVERAIREALSKAVQIADEQAAMGGDGFQVGHHISMQLRALGAKP